MHEMALANGIIDVIKEQAEAQGFQRVKILRLVIGSLSHVEPAAIEFCFDAVSRGTLAEGASVEIERPSGEAFCMGCSKTVPVGQRGDPCPECGGHHLMIVGGDELRVKELEVE